MMAEEEKIAPIASAGLGKREGGAFELPLGYEFAQVSVTLSVAGQDHDTLQRTRGLAQLAPQDGLDSMLAAGLIEQNQAAHAIDVRKR